MTARKAPSAAKKAAPKRKATGARKAARKRTTPAPRLSETVDAAVAAMHWLGAADAATVALARSYAAQIDEAVASGDDEAAAKAHYLGPHLLNTLRALGGTPGDRKALNVEEEARGKLAQLRALRGGAA